jgi:hypothetical protein
MAQTPASVTSSQNSDRKPGLPIPGPAIEEDTMRRSHGLFPTSGRSCWISVVIIALGLAGAPLTLGQVVVSACDETHLRAALAGGGSVTFTCSGTITLTAANGGAITISGDTSIDGKGQTVTISGGNAVQVFMVPKGVKLKLNQLTISGGIASGFNSSGGAIYSAGTLIVTNSTFSQNGSNFGGGAIFNGGGTLGVNNSTFFMNGSYYGGGIYNYAGKMTVNNSKFILNNFSEGFGGGIYNAGRATVTQSTFQANAVGAIANEGIMTVTTSTFGGNSNFPVFGGGIRNDGVLTVNQSTFFSNSGAGAISNSNLLTVSNSTFLFNSGILANLGGGILNGGTGTVTNSTFASNGAHGLDNAGTLTIQNTIVGNSSTSNCGSSGGSLVDGGGNLDTDGTCGVPIVTPASLNLATGLATNGGPTQTLALLSGSVAIANGAEASCPLSDQRGFPRPFTSACTTGAFEPGILFGSLQPKVRVNLAAQDFTVTGTFHLGLSNNGISPLQEVVQLRVGSFSIIIPAGAFQQSEDDGGFVYIRYVNGIPTFRMELQKLDGNKYSFRAAAQSATPGLPADNPLIVQLTVGDDGGTGMVQAKFVHEE